MTTANLPPIIREMNTHFVSKTDSLHLFGNIAGHWKYIPGLSGFWPMSSVGGSGQAIDMSDKELDLTNNNSAQFLYDTDKLFPYVNLNGTTQYFAGGNVLNLTGTEAFIATNRRGITIWTWVNFDASGNAEHVIAKDGAAGQRSYILGKNATNQIFFSISNDGTNLTTVTLTSLTIAIDTWYFIAGRFTPSSELKVYCSNSNVYETNVNTSAIPASTFVSTSPFEIGRRSTGANFLDGQVTLPGISSMILTDAMYLAMFEQSRGIVTN